MWSVCHLTQRASFTEHWWRTPALLHEGIWNIGCFWLADSLIYLRRPHAFIWFTLWYISESAAFAWSIKSLLFSCEAASPISISTACLRKTFLRIQPHDIFFRMFTSNKSLTSEYCKQGQCPGMPKLRWSVAVAEFWSGERNLKVQDMKRDENQSDNLRHLKTVCLDGLPLNRLPLSCYWGLPIQKKWPPRQDKSHFHRKRFSFSSGFACFNPCIVMEKSVFPLPSFNMSWVTRFTFPNKSFINSLANWFVPCKSEK